jgi:hypothetical protein
MDLTNPMNESEDETSAPEVVSQLDALAASDPADAPALADELADDLTSALDSVDGNPAAGDDRGRAPAAEREPDSET